MVTAYTLPGDVERVFKEVSHDILLLSARFSILKEISTNRENVDQLNSSAPVIFNTLQQLLQWDVILSFCRLLDRSPRNRPRRPDWARRPNWARRRIWPRRPNWARWPNWPLRPNWARRPDRPHRPRRPYRPNMPRNLTMETLIDELSVHGHCEPNTEREFRDQLAAIRGKASPLRRARNKRLAHTDLKERLERTDSVVPGVTLALIGELLDGMLDLRASVYECLVPGVTCDRHGVSHADYLRDLVAALRDAEACQEEKRARRRARSGGKSPD